MHFNWWCQRQRIIFFDTWHFGNVVWPLLAESECIGLWINSQLLGRQWQHAVVQSGSFLWVGTGHRVQSGVLLILFKIGVQANAVCLCCSCWCVKWNSVSWAGLWPPLYLPSSDYFTTLIFVAPLLIWEAHEKEKEKGEKYRERNRAKEPQIDTVPRINGWQQNHGLPMVLLSPSLIYDWDPQ